MPSNHVEPDRAVCVCIPSIWGSACLHVHRNTYTNMYLLTPTDIHKPCLFRSHSFFTLIHLMNTWKVFLLCVCTCTLKHMGGDAYVHMHTYRGRRTALMVFLTGLERVRVANPRYLPIPSSPALQLQMGTTILGLNTGPKACMIRTVPTEVCHQP